MLADQRWAHSRTRGHVPLTPPSAAAAEAVLSQLVDETQDRLPLGDALLVEIHEHLAPGQHLGLKLGAEPRAGFAHLARHLAEHDLVPSKDVPHELARLLVLATDLFHQLVPAGHVLVDASEDLVVGHVVILAGET
jgi:hypothetical protein